MAKVADELVIPVSKYPRELALPVLVPRATLPPQSAIWSIIILISLNCISEGLEERKAVFLSWSLGYAVSLPAPQRASTGGGNMTPAHPPHLPLLIWLHSSLLISFPPALDPLFSVHFFLPHRLLQLMWTETCRKHWNASGACRIWTFFHLVFFHLFLWSRNMTMHVLASVYMAQGIS